MGEGLKRVRAAAKATQRKPPDSPKADTPVIPITTIRWDEEMWDGLQELKRLLHDVERLNNSNNILANLASVIERAKAQTEWSLFGDKPEGLVHKLWVLTQDACRKAWDDRKREEVA